MTLEQVAMAGVREEIMIDTVEIDLDMAEKALQNIRDMDVKYEDLVHKVTMSFGVTESEKDRTMDEDINEADVLLYEAKESGRNQASMANLPILP